MGTGMGYRDDFYVVGNMYGYTGKINEKPTVYFKTDTEYGRITQDHEHKNNIGRNKVRNADGYTLRNEGHDGRGTVARKSCPQKSAQDHIDWTGFSWRPGHPVAVNLDMQGLERKGLALSNS